MPFVTLPKGGDHMIYLSPEVASGLGEDTFWTWFAREFPNSTFNKMISPSKNDVELRYSTLGESSFKKQSIALLWELYPEMKAKLGGKQWDKVIHKIGNCAKSCQYRVVASPLMIDYYKEFGHIDVLPIGVDMDLFKPMDKLALRRKHGIPLDARVGFWSGTTHQMKGFDRLLEWKRDNPDVYWIIVWKQKSEAGHLDGATNRIQVQQNELSELMNCADFFLSCGRLRPFYMVEWEAMACNIKPVIIGETKDFEPSVNPRDDLFARGWDRPSAKILWNSYINNVMANNK